MTRAEQAADLMGIINTYDLLTKYAAATGQPMPVAVTYIPKTTRFDVRQVTVWRPGFKVNHPSFVVWTVDKETQMQAARDWAAERYGVTEWAKVTGIRVTGAFVPKEVMDWFQQAFKAAQRQSAGAE